MKRRIIFFQSNWKNNRTFLITPTLFLHWQEDKMIIFSWTFWSIGFRYTPKKVFKLRMANMDKAFKKLRNKKR